MSEQERFEKACEHWVGAGRKAIEQIAFRDGWQARARIAEQEKRELVEALNALVNRKWSIASPIQARPDNDEAATHLMCSVEKPVIDHARALLAKHEAGSG